MSFEVAVEIDKEAEGLIKRLPLLIQHNAMDKAGRAFAKPVLDRMILRAPSSQETRTRDRWGPKYSKNPQWTAINSGVHQDYKLFKSPTGSLLYVGPKWPKGNKQQFNSPKSGQRPHKLWGNDTGRIYKITVRWQQRAFDESKNSALSAFTSKLRQEVEGKKLG